MSKTSMLLVEDQALLRDFFMLFFKGHEKLNLIRVAPSAEEALSQCRHPLLSLIIVDLNLPPNLLLKFLHNLRELCPMIPLVVIFSIHQPAYMRRILRSGALSFITRNSTGEELLFAIGEAMAGRKYLCREIKDAMAADLLGIEPAVNGTQLTSRELQIIGYLKQAYSSKQIATELNVALKTVEGYRHKILKKLNLKSSIALVQYINDKGL